MNKMMKRVSAALSGEEGASNVEILVWISVVLTIATVLFAFRTQITTWLTSAGNTIKGLKLK